MRAAALLCTVPACRVIAMLPDIPGRLRRHGRPQRVIRRKLSVIPVPVLARLRDEIGELVEETKRRELDHAVRPRLR